MFAADSGTDDKPWYRGYVLTLLLVLSIHNLSTRNLPSYLVTVQVPGCQSLCEGIATEPLCGTKKWDNFKKKPSRYEACQICRATGGAKGSLLQQDADLNEPTSFDELDALAGTTALTAEAAYASELSENAKPGKDNRVAKDANYYNMADGACILHGEYGLLIGYGFAVVFGIGSIAAGWICDRRSRVGIATTSLLAWSLATAMQATAHDFWSLLSCRAVIGLAQAFAVPAAISIGSDIFTSKQERQNMAMIVLSVGFYLGSGCASFSIWFADLLGWRWAVLLAGLSGMVIAAVFCLTVKEPERTEFTAPCEIAGVREEVFVKSRVARWCLLASSSKTLTAYVLGAYLPIWYSRAILPGYSNTAYAGFNALIIAFGGLLSTCVGSVLGAYWGQYDARAPCWIGVIGAVLSIPLVFLVVKARSFHGSMTCFFALMLASESWFAPTIALVQRSVRQSHRSQAGSMFLVATTLGANVGPALVGFLDPGDENIGGHIAWLTVVANLIAAAAFLHTAREITLDPIAAGLGDEGEDCPKSVGGVLRFLAPF